MLVPGNEDIDCLANFIAQGGIYRLSFRNHY